MLVTMVLMAIILGVFVYVAANASKDAAEYAPIQAKAFSIRAVFFWVLLVAGVLITIITTLDLPFAATRGNTEGVTKTINIEGRQWFWNIDDNTAQAGDTVLFNVTAGDVNHGLGVYTEDLVLLGQTQAMPGYTNSLKLTLTKPGTYKLMCLEYCGLVHHAMISDFVVTAKAN